MKFLLVQGQITLPLENMPAPAKTDRTCKPYREFNPKTGEFKVRKQQTMSLLSAKRTRGWWPCMTEDTEAGVLAVSFGIFHIFLFLSLKNNQIENM